MKTLYIEGSVKESVRVITELLAQDQRQQRQGKPMAKRDPEGRFVGAVNAKGSATTAPKSLRPIDVDYCVENVVTDSWLNKVEAIKKLRELTGLGLKESKDLVDAEYARRSNGNGADEVERGGSRLEHMRHKPHFVRPE